MSWFNELIWNGQMQDIIFIQQAASSFHTAMANNRVNSDIVEHSVTEDYLQIPLPKSPQPAARSISRAPADTPSNSHRSGENRQFQIPNLQTVDPFAEADDETGDAGTGNTGTRASARQRRNDIHIRVQQVSGGKLKTTLQGFPTGAKQFNPERVLKHLKRSFACNRNLAKEKSKHKTKEKTEDETETETKDKKMGEVVIQLHGDQRKNLYNFLVDKKTELNLDAERIKVHGF